jgi:hypothetical protein
MTEPRWSPRIPITIAICLIAASVFVAIVAARSDAATYPCTSRHEATATRTAETRAHLLARTEPTELWHSDRVRDYPGCIPSHTLRVRYAPRKATIRSAWWLTCLYHHQAECTKERLV